MLGVIQDVQGWYNDSMGRADPRVTHLPLARSPAPALSIVAVYVVVVTYGPRLMAPYKPLNLKWIIIPYNFAMVIFSFGLFLRTLGMAWRRNYSLVCQPVDYSDHPDATEAINIGWLFFFSKVIELVETVFFVLRKKNSQISFLHVYHHASVVMIAWAGMKWVPGGQSFIHPLLNSLVHSVMYLYYGMSSIGPHMQKYLWWKRYLTMFQLTQFVLMMTHTGVNLFMADCAFPKLFSKIVCAYAFSVMLLFLNFYFRAYIQKKRLPKEDKTQ